MIQITPQMRILVAVEPADLRKGVDGLARLCRQALQDDPFCGALFVFRNRRRTSLKLLCYDLGEAPCYVELWVGAGLYSRIPGPLSLSNFT